MAQSRKQALKHLHGWLRQVECHLEILAANPGDQATRHHQHEACNWLNQMEGVLRHVGKKTAAEWEARIRAYREALERSSTEPEA
jgi:hypothetical protein